MQRPQEANLSALPITADGALDIKVIPAYSHSWDHRDRRRVVRAAGEGLDGTTSGEGVPTSKKGDGGILNLKEGGVCALWGGSCSRVVPLCRAVSSG